MNAQHLAVLTLFLACSRSSADPAPSPRSAGAILDGEALRARDPALGQTIQDTVRHRLMPTLEACAVALSQRRVLTSRVNFSMQLDVALSGGHGRFRTADSSDWPIEFDEPMRGCIRDVFLGAAFASPGEKAFRITYPMCLQIGDATAPAMSATPGKKKPDAPSCAPLAEGIPVGEQFAEQKKKVPWSANREREVRAYVTSVLPAKTKIEVLQCRCPCCIVAVKCVKEADCNKWMEDVQRGYPPGAESWIFDSRPPPADLHIASDDLHEVAYVCY